MTLEELTSRLDQGWADIVRFRATIRLLAEHGSIPPEAVRPEADPEEVRDLENRIIRACATIVLMEIWHRERTRDE